jgi:hypothetical protein
MNQKKQTIAQLTDKKQVPFTVIGREGLHITKLFK